MPDAAEVGFIGRSFLIATFPHRDPGDVTSFVRRNGTYTLTVYPGRYGLPYGTYPRLVLAWMSTAAVRQGTRHLRLDASVEAFMNRLGLELTGGKTGTLEPFKEQMHRLLTCRLNIDAGMHHGEPFPMATDADLWWDAQRVPYDENESSSIAPTITLGKVACHQMRRHPIPFDMRVLRAVRQSPLAVDLYLWLTYRVSYLKTATEISWRQLHDQFGADYAEVKQFARKVRKHLKAIQLAWPELQYETPYGRLRLHPSMPHISPRGAS